MDTEILANRLASTEASLLRLDQRLDELCERIGGCETQVADQSALNGLTERLATLEAERQILSEQARIAEAEAAEAQAVAVEAEAEALLVALSEEEEEEEVAGEPELEVIEAEEPPKENPNSSSSRSQRSDLEDLVRGR